MQLADVFHCASLIEYQRDMIALQRVLAINLFFVQYRGQDDKKASGKTPRELQAEEYLKTWKMKCQEIRRQLAALTLQYLTPCATF